MSAAHAMTITVSGDRQAGKTHAALATACIDAMAGRQVVYQGYTLRYADYQMQGAEQLIPQQLIRKAYWTNGRQRIELHNGGVIRFRSHSQAPLDPSEHVDTYVLDDWASSWVPEAASRAGHLIVCQMADDR